jgi:hypothetical protein
VLLGLASIATAGELRVTCDPGYQVFVDDEPVGVTTEEEAGLVLSAVDDGEHVVRVAREGEAPMEAPVVVGDKSNQLVFMRIQPPPAPKHVEPVEGAGTIVIKSDFPSPWVEFAGQRFQKKADQLIIPNIPVGQHTVWMQQLATLLEQKVAVSDGGTVILTADFRNKKVVGERRERPAEDGEGARGKGNSKPCVLHWIEVIRTSSVKKVGNISDVLAEGEYPLYRQKLITVESGEIPLYRLCIGPFANRYSADRALFKLKQGGLNPGARVFFEACPD